MDMTCKRAAVIGGGSGLGLAAVHALCGMGWNVAVYDRAEPENLPTFLTGNRFDALNVTIPYKKDVIPFLAEISADAKAITPRSINRASTREISFFIRPFPPYIISHPHLCGMIY